MIHPSVSFTPGCFTPGSFSPRMFHSLDVSLPGELVGAETVKGLKRPAPDVYAQDGIPTVFGEFTRDG